MKASTKEQIIKHSKIMEKYRGTDPFGDPNHGTPDWMDDVLEVIYAQEEFLGEAPDIDLDIE
ncbi:hypothetical protein CH373_01460 [Leptospira perolatii]|uniref:Uncharacterized protein n=1 Tax=Leptospira perolatii TaxID=2023191 RepID=A0A2M9ZRZ0_9LEPT|nr:hypothetical protein [Leptospira perolatii]PJZ71208.1 hypothetical protein CH360_01460 [Leptospira perolatii]PJZ74741.1 hypothetical protein CH373_01460 [Leptospira perolatii]